MGRYLPRHIGRYLPDLDDDRLPLGTKRSCVGVVALYLGIYYQSYTRLPGLTSQSEFGLARRFKLVQAHLTWVSGLVSSSS